MAILGQVLIVKKDNQLVLVKNYNSGRCVSSIKADLDKYNVVFIFFTTERHRISLIKNSEYPRKNRGETVSIVELKIF